MEFKLFTSGHFYISKKRRIELEKIGFTFKHSDFIIEVTPTI